MANADSCEPSESYDTDDTEVSACHESEDGENCESEVDEVDAASDAESESESDSDSGSVDDVKTDTVEDVKRKSLTDLINEYEEFKKILNNKKQNLFQHKLSELLNIDVNIIKKHIINCEFTTTNEGWIFSYIFTTNGISNGSADLTSELVLAHGSKMILEKNNKYQIRGNGDKYKVYIKIKNKIQIIRKKYEIEFDIKKHNLYINNIAKRFDTPECIIINLLLYINNHEWTNKQVIDYFTF